MIIFSDTWLCIDSTVFKDQEIMSFLSKGSFVVIHGCTKKIEVQRSSATGGILLRIPYIIDQKT